MRFSGERVVVVGAGVAGRGAVRALIDEGADVVVTEAAEVPATDEIRALGADVRHGGHERSHLEGAALVVASPGVLERAPVLEWARERGVPVWGELELGVHLTDAPMIAVTGTNGKTTTTGMIASILRAAGEDAIACGNIGHPLPIAAREGHDVLVVECSSFQLRMQESFHPRISVLLNVAADHLDWHGSFEAYTEAKARIFALQRDDDVHVGNKDDERAAAISDRAPCSVVWSTTGSPDDGDIGYEGDQLVARRGTAVRLGPVDAERAGYRADAAAAAAAALAFGAPPDAVTAGLASFTPARHRGEVVAEAAGVRFLDNSKATNVHAVLASLVGGRNVVLIAGGRSKGVDLSPLGEAAEALTGVVAIGEAAAEIAQIFEGIVPTRKAGSIEEATRTAFELASPGGVVLLAPACASWDMFANYGERGDRFTAEARALAGSVASDE